MSIDVPAIRSRHRLGDVARRFGVGIEADTGDVFVRCPMPQHPADKTPSMMMHLDTDRYHCFGCGATGDVMQWVQDILGVDFLNAVRALESDAAIVPAARRDLLSVVAPNRTTKSGAEHPVLSRTPTSRILAAMAAAWSFYSSDQPHDQAVEYLVGRGINMTHLEEETGQRSAGRTPGQATGLRDRLRSTGFTDDELVDASLINRYSDGRRTTDFFRQRVIVPVRDDEDRVIGFVGRDVSDARPDFVPAKYLNSRATVTYDKSVAIYRPSRPQLSKHASIVLVEGTLDALMIASIAAEASLSQHYAPVSTSGLEWSDTQRAALRLIHPYPPALAFDGDHSGLGANLARGRDFLADGIETVVTIWPDQQDPADYLREHGPCGLAAVTRKGCLQPGPELRPRHIGEIIAQAALLDRVSRSPAVERALTDIVALADLLPVRGANRYLVAVAAATPSQLRGHLDAVAAIAERRTTEVQSSRAARQGNELELSPNKTLGGAAL